jgi:hypothetical protein
MRIANRNVFAPYYSSLWRKPSQTPEYRIYFAAILEIVSDAWDELPETSHLCPGGQIELNAIQDDQ